MESKLGVGTVQKQQHNQQLQKQEQLREDMTEITGRDFTNCVDLLDKEHKNELTNTQIQTSAEDQQMELYKDELRYFPFETSAEDLQRDPYKDELRNILFETCSEDLQRGLYKDEFRNVPFQTCAEDLQCDEHKNCFNSNLLQTCTEDLHKCKHTMVRNSQGQLFSEDLLQGKYNNGLSNTQFKTSSEDLRKEEHKNMLRNDLFQTSIENYHKAENKIEPRINPFQTYIADLNKEKHKNQLNGDLLDACNKDLHEEKLKNKLIADRFTNSNEDLHREEIKNEVSNAQFEYPSEELHKEENQHDISKTRFETSKFPAPDGGYGWLVVLGCFISHVVFAGFDRSEGIIFLLLTSKFEQNAQLTSWPGAIACTLQLLLGPLATAMSNRYSPRVSVMLGAVLVFLGTLFSSFSPNFPFYFICHGVIDGFGRGMAYVPGLAIVGMYFDKRAGLAVGLATSGAGIGTFLIVPFTQYLADHYGFQGTFLILSGVACHIFIAALLYRPLRMHYQSINSFKGGRREKTKTEFYAAFVQNKDETKKLDVHDPSTELTDTQAAQNATTIEHPSTSLTNNTEVSYLETTNLPRFSKTCENSFRNDETQNDNCFMLSFQVCCPIDRNDKQKQSCFSFHLLRNPSFILFCLSILTFTMAFRAAFTFIPALIESKGIPKSQAALALSAAGAVDTFGRIGTGFFLDLPRVRPFRLALYNIVIFAVGLVAFFLPLISTITMFCVMSGLYGLLTGAYISQKSVVLVDMLDPPDVASSFGILMVFQGLGCLFGPPLAGALRDVFGSYDESFYFGGGLLVLAGLLMVLCNMCNKLGKR